MEVEMSVSLEEAACGFQASLCLEHPTGAPTFCGTVGQKRLTM